MLALQKEGTSKRRLNKNNGDQNQKSANAAIEKICDALILSIGSPLESWILDFGASFHFTSQREIMDNYIGGDFRKVYLADDEPLKIVGKGDVIINLPNESVWKILNV